MPQTPHIEHHFTGSEVVRDIVIGMSDGLTVPFALAAGLSSAAASTHTGSRYYLNPYQVESQFLNSVISAD